MGRSLNYYPVGDEAPADGVCQVAVGLGKYIVDGGRALRFSPLHPHHVLQTSTTKLALRDTQTHFCALDVANYQQPFSLDEGRNIAQLPVQPHADNGELQYMVSTYDYHNDRMLDTDAAPGRKVVTFANVLNHDVFPLAKITQFMLEQGQRQMGRPVEIELAGVIASQREMQRGHRGELYWLQIRPMIDRREMLDDTVIHAPVEQVLLRSNNAIGHGTMDGVTGVVMVKPEFFSFENNLAIAEEIAKINRNFTDWGENYILVGVGRWGSSDTALGIPVKWQHISAARVIVEMALPDGTIEPSQGTHFFQNLTSFGVGYVTLDARNGEDVIDLEFIQEQKPYEESDFVKVLRFVHPLQVAINGQQGIAVVLKPHD